MTEPGSNRVYRNAFLQGLSAGFAITVKLGALDLGFHGNHLQLAQEVTLLLGAVFAAADRILRDFVADVATRQSQHPSRFSLDAMGLL